MNYDLKSPCPKCPFRSNIPGYLSRRRVAEIARGLVRGDFPCHQTTADAEDETGINTRVATAESQHCAGALILLEKLEEPSQMMRICERLRMYDASKLHMDAPVYDSWEEMIEAQPR